MSDEMNQAQEPVVTESSPVEASVVADSSSPEATVTESSVPVVSPKVEAIGAKIVVDKAWVDANLFPHLSSHVEVTFSDGTTNRIPLQTLTYLDITPPTK